MSRKGQTKLLIMQSDSEKLRRYLLGDLDDAEMDVIDFWIISDDDSAAALSSAEHDLLEDYLENNLSKEESVLFGSNFLISDERRQQLDEIALLKRAAAASKPVVSPIDESRSSFVTRLFPFSRPVMAAFAVVVIVVAAFVGWRAFLSPATAPGTEYAALNGNDLAGAESRYSTIQLVSGTLRGTSAGSRFTTAGTTESILFRLALPFKPAAGYRPKTELMKDNNAIFTVESSRIYPTGPGSEVRVLITRFLLTGGQHQIRLTDGGNPDTELMYGFTVE